jgi:hypothetical protein
MRVVKIDKVAEVSGNSGGGAADAEKKSPSKVVAL